MHGNIKYQLIKRNEKFVPWKVNSKGDLEDTKQEWMHRIAHTAGNLNDYQKAVEQTSL